MMDGDASVVSSSEGKTVAILSNNLLSASFSIVVELSRLSLVHNFEIHHHISEMLYYCIHAISSTVARGVISAITTQAHTLKVFEGFFDKLIHLAPHLLDDWCSTVFLEPHESVFTDDT